MTDAPEALAHIPREHTQDGPNVRLYLVDGSGFIFRAYHALPPLTRKSDGLPVGAVSGFCNMLWKLLVDMKSSEDAPTHLAVIFDHSEKTFRNALYDQYKAHRPPAPEDLVPQFPLVREATLAFGVPSIELAGYEADDVIASYACHVRDMGGEVVIVSSDKDLMQLVGDRVSMLATMKQVRLGRRIKLATQAVEQQQVQLHLAMLQHLGDGRLRYMQQLRSAADRAGLHDRVEDLDMSQPHEFNSARCAA